MCISYSPNGITRRRPGANHSRSGFDCAGSAGARIGSSIAAHAVVISGERPPLPPTGLPGDSPRRANHPRCGLACASSAGARIGSSTAAHAIVVRAATAAPPLPPTGLRGDSPPRGNHPRCGFACAGSAGARIGSSTAAHAVGISGAATTAPRYPRPGLRLSASTHSHLRVGAGCAGARIGIDDTIFRFIPAFRDPGGGAAVAPPITNVGPAVSPGRRGPPASRGACRSRLPSRAAGPPADRTR